MIHDKHIPPIRMVVALGNPGVRYAKTRHNVGFMLLEQLLGNQGITPTLHRRWKAMIAKMPQSDALAVFPQTFMNLSGQAVVSCLRFYHWEPQQVFVVYDDASLPLGALRLRQRGSAGGHNGIKSIIEELGTQDFPRLKVGIGSPRPGAMVGHVLGDFLPEEENELQKVLARGQKAVQCALRTGVQDAANQFNGG